RDLTQSDLTNTDPGLDVPVILPPEDRIPETTVDPVPVADPLGPPALNPQDPPGNSGPGVGNPAFPGRSGATKARMLREGGGNGESEAAVAAGLAWLARQQKPDGSWQFDGSSIEDVIASTGMALLPFLAAGETHKRGKYQMTVKKGLEFLVKNLNA